MHIPVCIPPVAVIANMAWQRSMSSGMNEAHKKRMKELDDELAMLKAANADRERERVLNATLEHFRREIKADALKYNRLLELMKLRQAQCNAPTSSDI